MMQRERQRAKACLRWVSQSYHANTPRRKHAPRSAWAQGMKALSPALLGGLAWIGHGSLLFERPAESMETRGRGTPREN